MISMKNNPVGIYMFKVNNRNNRTRCEICSKLTIKTPEKRERLFLKGMIFAKMNGFQQKE